MAQAARAADPGTRPTQQPVLKLSCGGGEVDAAEAAAYLKRLVRKASQGTLKLAHLFTNAGVPLCQADLRLVLNEDEARRVEQRAAHALQQYCGSGEAGGTQDPLQEPMLNLCKALHIHLAQLHRLQGGDALDGRSPAASEGTAQRLLDVVTELHALLVAHLPAFPSTPLLVHVALTSGKLAPALLQLLAHRSMRDLARHVALTEQVLGLVAVLASPDLQPLLLQASRFSNEHLSLAQVLMVSAHQARALMSCPEVPGDGGAAARHVASLVLYAYDIVQARAGGGDADMDEAPGSPAVQIPALANSAAAQPQGSTAAGMCGALATPPGGVLRSPVCAALRSAMKRPASTELDEIGRSLGVSVRVSPSLAHGRSTPDWQGSPVAAAAAARQQAALAEFGAGAAAAERLPGSQPRGEQQQQTPPPPPQPRPGHLLTNVVLESARRLSATLHVSPPVSTRATSSGNTSPLAPIPLSRLHAGGAGSSSGPGSAYGSGGAAAGTATPPGRPCTPSDLASPGAVRLLLCEEAPAELVDSPNRPGTGLLGLFSAHVPTGAGGGAGAEYASAGGAAAAAAAPLSRAALAGLRPVAISSPGAPRNMQEDDSPSPSSGAVAPWGTPTTEQQPSSPECSTWGSPGSWGPGEDGPKSRFAAAAAAHAAAAAAAAGSGGEAPGAEAPPLPSCVLPLPISSLSSRLAAMQAGGLISGPSPNRAGGAVLGHGSPLRRSSAAAPPAWPAGAGGTPEHGAAPGEARADCGAFGHCGMDSEDGPACPGLPPAGAPEDAQPAPLVRISVYGQDGAVALLDPGFLRPDSPMCTEVPAAAAAWAAEGGGSGGAAPGAAAARPTADAALAPGGTANAISAAAGLPGVAVPLSGGDLGLPSIRTHEDSIPAGSAAPAAVPLEPDEAALCGRTAAGVVGAAREPAALQDGEPLEGVSAVEPAAPTEAAAALLAGPAAAAPGADAQPGTPSSTRDTAPQLDRRRSSRQISNSMLGAPLPPRRASGASAGGGAGGVAGEGSGSDLGADDRPDALGECAADHRLHPRPASAAGAPRVAQQGQQQREQLAGGPEHAAAAADAVGGGGVEDCGMAVDGSEGADLSTPPEALPAPAAAGPIPAAACAAHSVAPATARRANEGAQGALRQQAVMPAAAAWRLLSVDNEPWGSPRSEDLGSPFGAPPTPDPHHLGAACPPHHAGAPALRSSGGGGGLAARGAPAGRLGGPSCGCSGVAALMWQQQAGTDAAQLMRGSWESSAPGSPIGEPQLDRSDLSGWDSPLMAPGAEPSAPLLRDGGSDGAPASALLVAAAALYVQAAPGGGAAAAGLQGQRAEAATGGLARSWGSGMIPSGLASPCPSVSGNFSPQPPHGEDQERGAGRAPGSTSGGAARTRHRLATQGAPASPSPLGGRAGGGAEWGVPVTAGGFAELLLGSVSECEASLGPSAVAASGDGEAALGCAAGGGDAMEADSGPGCDDRDQAGRTHESPLVGARQPMASLVVRYRAASPGLAARLAALAPSFPACRPVAGDGNCFYRAFVFALLEALLETPHPELLASLVRNMGDALVAMRQSLPPCPEAERGGELLLSLLSRIWYAPSAQAQAAPPPVLPVPPQPPAPGQQLPQLQPQVQAQPAAGPLFMPELESLLARRDAFDAVVRFARLAASLELRRHEELYAPFVAGCGDAYDGIGFSTLCERHVERMGQEVEQLQMAALAAAAGVTIGVIDVAGSETGAVRHPASGGDPVFHLLHLPGHYEITYTR